MGKCVWLQAKSTLRSTFSRRKWPNLVRIFATLGEIGFALNSLACQTALRLCLPWPCIRFASFQIEGLPMRHTLLAFTLMLVGLPTFAGGDQASAPPKGQRIGWAGHSF